MTTVLSSRPSTAPPTVARPTLARPRRDRLFLTLAITIAVKCAVLYGLWHAFFSHPQTRHMLLPAGQVERHLFTVPAAPCLHLNPLDNKQVIPCLRSTMS